MYSVLVVSDNEQINKELAALKKIAPSIKIKKILADGKSAYDELKNQGYDFVLAPSSLITGFRTEEELSEPVGDIEAHYAERVFELFLSRSGKLEEYLTSVKNEVSSKVLDAAKAEKFVCSIYSSAITKVFSHSEWLELYLSHEDFEGQGSAYIKDRLLALSREYTELFPLVSNDKTEEVVLYILNNPESDLRQKTIASKMYVNSSYLSTVFAAQTGERFVDYLTSVKLKRAAYLLMNSTLRVSEIAARLDYKDIGYFSRLFRTRYGIPPSEYRIPDNYTYEI